MRKLTVTSLITISPLLSLSLFGQTLLLNAGSPSPSGVYQQDDFYIGGNTATLQSWGPGVYQTLRYGTLFTYNIQVPNGLYEVVYHLYEPNAKFPNGRIFKITTDSKDSGDIDIFARSGFRIPYTYKENVEVTNSTLFIQFRATVGNAVVSAIEVKPQKQETHLVSERFDVGARFAPSFLNYTLKESPAPGAFLEVYERGNTSTSYTSDLYLIYYERITSLEIQIALPYPLQAGTNYLFVYTAKGAPQ